jgi:hypothetical protein
MMDQIADGHYMAEITLIERYEPERLPWVTGQARMDFDVAVFDGPAAGFTIKETVMALPPTSADRLKLEAYNSAVGYNLVRENTEEVLFLPFLIHVLRGEIVAVAPLRMTHLPAGAVTVRALSAEAA